MSTDNEIIKRAIDIIIENEGGYTSVNPDDNGALSIGRLQWHATRALKLLKSIVSAMGTEEALLYLSERLFEEIKREKTWSARTLGVCERGEIEAILSSEQSRAVQDCLAASDVRSYIEHIRSLGVEEECALIFMADIENQGGAAASRRIILAADGKDVDALYRSAECDRVFCDRMKRRARVYAALTGRIYGEEASDYLLYEIRHGDTLSMIAREYKVSVRELCQMNSIKDPDRIRVGDIIRIPSIDTEKDLPAMDSYTVKKGDTLSGIAHSLSLDYKQIAKINEIEPPYVIYPGQVLRLCFGECDAALTHKVVRGDTLSRISRLYSVSIDAVISKNKKKYKNISPSYIVAGWELIIPQEGENDNK